DRGDGEADRRRVVGEVGDHADAGGDPEELLAALDPAEAAERDLQGRRLGPLAAGEGDRRDRVEEVVIADQAGAEAAEALALLGDLELAPALPAAAVDLADIGRAADVVVVGGEEAVGVDLTAGRPGGDRHRVLVVGVDDQVAGRRDQG